MEKIYDKCCGIDVHKKLIVACFKTGRKQEIKEFGATTKELPCLADWLMNPEQKEAAERISQMPGFGDVQRSQMQKTCLCASSTFHVSSN